MDKIMPYDYHYWINIAKEKRARGMKTGKSNPSIGLEYKRRAIERKKRKESK